MPKISIHIVTWNSGDMIPVCLEGVFQQTYTNFQVIVVDNCSEDGTVDFIQKEYPQVYILKNDQNLGFSKAHNQAIRQSTAEFILVLNPDVYLEQGFLGAAVKALEENKAFGAVAPKLFVIRHEDFITRKFPSQTIIDCMGLDILKSRRLVLHGHLQKDNPDFDRPVEVFGADGAAPFFRRVMLEDIKYHEEYFDEDFFSYKEDHDLAWRAQWMGWKTLYVPEARAFHVRTTTPGKRKEMKSTNRLLGIRNRYLMMRKNDSPYLMSRHIMHILLYECKIFFYLLLFERESWPGYVQAWRLKDRMKCKRKQLMARRKISDPELIRWFL